MLPIPWSYERASPLDCAGAETHHFGIAGTMSCDAAQPMK